MSSTSQAEKSKNNAELLNGMPKLVSIGVAPRGIIAIQLVPMGIIAIGAVSMGAITVGVVSMGLINVWLDLDVDSLFEASK